MTDFEKQAYQEVLESSASDATIKCVELDVLAKEKGFSEYKDKNSPANSDTFFAWGTELAESGKVLFKSTNKLHHEMDFSADCAAKFDEVIASENRRDIAVNLPQVKLNSSTDQLFVANDAYGFTRWSLGQLLTRASAPSGSLTVLKPTDSKHQRLPHYMQNDVFNSYMSGAKNKKGDIQANLRTRKYRNRNEVFAAVSPRFQTFDANVACKEFAKHCHETGKGEIKYDGRKWKFTSTVMTDLEPVVGEIFEARSFITGADDGSMPVIVGSEVVKVRCKNLTVLSSEITDSVKHSCRSMAERIENLMQKANARINDFAEGWKKASTESFADPEMIEQYGIDKLFKLLVDRKYVIAAGADDTTMVNRLMSAWATEPGYTKAAVLNAITKAAHVNTWQNPWTSEEISEQAGELLYARVYFSSNDFSSLIP